MPQSFVVDPNVLSGKKRACSMKPTMAPLSDSTTDQPSQ